MHRKLSKRIISGLIGASLTVIILFFDQNFQWLINCATAIISILAIREIFAVLEISNLYILTIPTTVYIPIILIAGHNTLWELSFYLYTILMFSSMMQNKEIKLRDVCIVYSMTILISFSLFKMVDLRNYGGDFGNFYVFLALSIAWMSDTGAYFCGKLFGKSKLCPEISPKKTLEGFIGGIIVCLLCVILIAAVFNNYVFPQKQQINYFSVIVLGILGSLISSLGDLCFSTIKRKCGVKDFGNLMPGHGGILDRFDSVIFVVPFVYLYLNFIPIIF